MKSVFLIPVLFLVGCGIHTNMRCYSDCENQSLALRTLADENIRLNKENQELKQTIKHFPKQEPVIGVNR